MQTKLSIFATKLIEAGWLAAVVTIPLFFNIYTARTFEPDKLTLMRSIVTVMVLAWLVKLLEEGAQSGSTAGSRFNRWLKKPMTLPVILIALAYLISTALSISPHVSFWGSYQRLQGTYTFISYIIIFALMATNMTTRQQVDRFVTTVIIASVPVALYGIIQHNGLDPLPWAGDVTTRVASNMGNAIFVASYLIMVVPLTISRLIGSMKAIVTEENASWGHTVLSAVYIFVLAVQVLTIFYSLSRGPQIGMLGGLALMGLLLLLVLRQKAQKPGALTLNEISLSIGLVLVVVLVSALVGGVGYFIGKAIEALLLSMHLQISGASLMGAIIGGLLGFTGVYAYFAASNKGWRWVWLSWPLLGLITATVLVSFIVALNNPNSPVASLKSNPYFRRMAGVLNTESGTGEVRVLIWEGALKLISPHRPLGVEGEVTDSFNAIRPLIGYGPESMFNAFAFAYPPNLAHVENRGSSADRSHNETMDSLVMTGALGFLAFYFLMGSLFYYALKWLGWVPDRAARWRLIGLMVAVGLAGALAPFFKEGSFVLSAVGLPFGVFAGVIAYLIWQGFLSQPAKQINTVAPILLIGLLSALTSHFLEVHFVFSIAATYTYFWAYLGVMVALWRIETQSLATETAESLAENAPETTPTPKTRRKRKKSRTRTTVPKVIGNRLTAPETWEMWLGSLGLAMAIILVILTFDFVPIQFSFATGRYSLLWMLSITYLVGVAIAMADTAVKQHQWQSSVNWGRAALLYSVTSLGYAAFYILFHSQQRHTLTSGRLSDALQAANGLVGLLYGFYITLFILLAIISVMLAQKQFRRLATWRISNWWLYPPLIVAALLIIYFKNINVVKADLYLKEGDRYRTAQQWNNAVRLHQAAIDADSDEDFYYLMLALDYQLEAQDGRLDPQARQQAWLQGEKIALEARRINIYNPDNTGNMGRYYFTLGQILDPSYFDKAKTFFKKVVQLAPQNVQYYNLLAQVYYVQGDYDSALDWLNKSVALDAEFPPTWLQLGDTYAAKSDVAAALNAHRHAISLDPASFADANFDSRLNFYISANRTDDLVAAFEQYITDHPGDSRALVNKRNQTAWAIGHTYLRAGVITQATQYLQQAVSQGYQNAQTLLELADVYLTQQQYPQAESLYQQALSKTNPNQQAQIYSSLGYIYAKIGRIQDAIDANNKVLQILPNDYDSHKNLALLYQQTGQLDQAITQAQAALNVAPKNAQTDLQTYIDQLKAAQGQ